VRRGVKINLRGENSTKFTKNENCRQIRPRPSQEWKDGSTGGTGIVGSIQLDQIQDPTIKTREGTW
jgi:hypothetical protein